MSIFLLTPSSCDYAKRAMRAQLPHVKSAHLTEAMASAFGFQTHAALRAAMDITNAGRPILVSVESSRLGARLQEMG